MSENLIYRLWAVVAVAALAVGGWAVVGAFRGDFEDSVTVHVMAERAGLALEPGAMVKRHGVRIGEVETVEVTDGGAEITVAIEPDAAAHIPSNTAVQIRSSTVFGGKSVDVVDPAVPAADGVADGARISADSVSVEINTVFESLTGMLGAVEPDKLNEILGTLAQALHGQGASLGIGLDDLDTVLGTLNARIPEIGDIARSGAATATIYAAAADDLLAALKNLTTTAKTVIDKTPQFDDLLAGVLGLANRGDAVLEPNSDKLVKAIVLFEPTAALLDEYSPVLTCFIKGVDVARTEAEKVSGGNGSTMLLNSTILMGTQPYSYPKNLPKVAATGGPRCGPLPKVDLSQVPTPYVVADTGANPFADSTGGPAVVPQSILEFMLGGSGR
ncbi:MCE family protein [Gordonia liuliyuniae]|uniref:MCE family protein n=1 Tax=Gordonia liuliyuniae TaxID=2911517 RepID=A0ABS9INN5_9ACTN|nr:MCE family protein [Gordonia liuliyuniae]MCF8587178.1 MCE family protein [Gordonia liuliyuniae]